MIAQYLQSPDVYQDVCSGYQDHTQHVEIDLCLVNVYFGQKMLSEDTMKQLGTLNDKKISLTTEKSRKS